MIGALRWVIGATGPRLAPRLLPLWMAIGFLVSQFWTVIDWDGVRAAFARFPVGIGAGLAVAVAAMVGGAVRDALRRPELRAIWRTPIGRWRRGLLVIVPAAVMMSPALAALLFAPPRARAAALVISLLPVMRWRGLPLVVLALTSPLLVVPASLGAVWLAGDTMLRTTPDAAAWAAMGMPRLAGPVRALVWRDLLAITRTSGGRVAAFLVPGLPLAGLLWGMRVNGGFGVDARAQAVAVSLCLVAPLAGAALGDLRRALGRDVDSPRLPVGPGVRWVGLAVVVLVGMAPTGAALAAVDPGAVASPTAGLAWGALVACTVLVLAWARPGGRRPYSMGAQAALCLGVLGLVLWDSGLARGIQLLVALVGGVLGRVGLARTRRMMQEGRW